MDTIMKACASYLVSSSTGPNHDKGMVEPAAPSACTSIPGNRPSPPMVSCPKGNSPTVPRWIRPLGYCETFMTNAHKFGIMTTVYALYLDSRTPIHIDLVRQAVHILYKKFPHLRLSIGHRNGTRWWKERNSDTLDVEEEKTKDITATFEAILKRKYNVEEGPLWFMRFMKDTESEEFDTNHNLKYNYVCLFGFHHNFTDGTTNMKSCKVFMSILNDLILGRDINMAQEGYFALPLHDQMADSRASYWYLFGVFIRRFYRGILSYGAYVSNFTTSYPLSAQNEASTKAIYYEIDEVATQNLLKRCKMERVTLNSAFTAAANLGLYRIIQEYDSSLKETHFSSLQALNMRRYWPKEKQQNSFGCHISMLDVHFKTASTDIDDFWEYTRKVHSSVKSGLDETPRALLGLPIGERINLIVQGNSWLSWLRLPSTNDSHYCVTNMGNLSQTFPGTGTEVEVSRVVRSVSGHLMPSLCQHTLHTFRNRLCYSIDYYTQKMERETAEKYSKSIVDILKESIFKPN
ncbi:unnamed protein product [Meganyctiphanes norvegica]|uniref:Condensation domain-containing protein n=1 Tax=Meganyctiphanes norvegica TaxID=48144 RepID=A0AAV2RXG3_MEGNR